MLAAKTALAARVDALGEEATSTMGVEHRAYLEARLKQLEQGDIKRISGGRKSFQPQKYDNKSEVRQYLPSSDSTIKTKKGKKDDNEEEEDEEGNFVIRDKPPKNDKQ